MTKCNKSDLSVLDNSDLRDIKNDLDIYSDMADGEISSRFSILHSSKNSRMGEGCEPTEM